MLHGNKNWCYVIICFLHNQGQGRERYAFLSVFISEHYSNLAYDHDCVSKINVECTNQASEKIKCVSRVC